MNQRREPYNRQLYALDDQEFQEVQGILSLIRQIRIMMWAYRFDHARYVMRIIEERYGQLLRLGEQAIRDSQFYPYSSATQSPMQEEYFDIEEDDPSSEDDTKRKESPDNKQSDVKRDNEREFFQGQVPDRRNNPYIAIAGITTTTDFLANRLNMNETATAPDYNRFEYGLLQLGDNEITIRAYLFDDLEVTPVQYFDAFRQLRNVQVSLDQQFSQNEEYSYPLGLRLFSDSYFAEMMIFAPDYAEILFHASDESNVYINRIIQQLNTTRENAR